MLTPSISEANQNPGEPKGEPTEAGIRRHRATYSDWHFG